MLLETKHLSVEFGKPKKKKKNALRKFKSPGRSSIAVTTFRVQSETREILSLLGN